MERKNCENFFYNAMNSLKVDRNSLLLKAWKRKFYEKGVVEFEI